MISLDGRSLTIEQVQAVALHDEPVSLAADAIERMLRSRAVVERLAAGDEPVYAVNTGVGLLADVRVAAEDLEQLQRNVVRSHAAGIGDPLARGEVRAMMLIRANVLAAGFSGIRPLIAERLCGLLNHGVTPVVPSQGSVGASGDLAPLAHIALVLIGEGEAEYQGERLTGGEALRRAGIAPVTLASKEGISLVNGTQAMLAVGSLELGASEVLAASADLICAMTLDALRGTPRAFDERLHATRPHPGQIRSATRLSAYLEGSEIRESHITCRRVQDAYSLRCAPQVHGAVLDTLAEARRTFSIELNSVTDNPVVIGDEIISGGNFHGEPLAFQLDFLAEYAGGDECVSQAYRIGVQVGTEPNPGGRRQADHATGTPYGLPEADRPFCVRAQVDLLLDVGRSHEVGGTVFDLKVVREDRPLNHDITL